MPYTESKIINIKYYWLTWFSIVGLMLLFRFSFFLNSPEDLKYSLFSTYTFITWFPIMGVGFYNGKKFRKYLDKFHPEIFNKFYSHAFGTITIDDPFGLIKFCFSKEKYDDYNLNKLKDFQKNFSIFTLIVFISYPVCFFINML